MQLSKKSMLELAEMIADVIVTSLEKRGVVGRASGKSGDNDRPKKTAYQRTEQLLYNYRGFKKIVAARMEEIENLKKYGVPKRSASIVEYSPHSGTVGGIVLPEESVEQAIRTVQDSIVDTVQAIALIDKCMATLKSDPYYRILEMRYFEGRTQEDIALEFGCSQVTISNNKSRLVKELATQLFPNQVIEEMLN